MFEKAKGGGNKSRQREGSDLHACLTYVKGVRKDELERKSLTVAQLWDNPCQADGKSSSKSCLLEESCIVQEWPALALLWAWSLAGSSLGWVWPPCEPSGGSTGLVAGAVCQLCCLQQILLKEIWVMHLHGYPCGESHPESSEAFAIRREGWRIRHAFPDQGTTIVNCCLSFRLSPHRNSVSNWVGFCSAWLSMLSELFRGKLTIKVPLHCLKVSLAHRPGTLAS